MAKPQQPTVAPSTDLPTRTQGPRTGPMPALVFDDGHLQVQTHGDVTVLCLDGGLDADLLAVVAPVLEVAAGAANAIVVDLDQVTLLDHGACVELESCVRAAANGVPMCFAASRLSARVVLDRWGLSERVPVFGSVADALQVREFAESGYGPSW